MLAEVSSKSTYIQVKTSLKSIRSYLKREMQGSVKRNLKARAGRVKSLKHSEVTLNTKIIMG